MGARSWYEGRLKDSRESNARLEGGVFGSYIHHDGTVGVLMQCQGKAAADEALRDICAHVAAMNPLYMK